MRNVVWSGLLDDGQTDLSRVSRICIHERRIIQEVPGFGCSTNILPKWLKNAFEVICFRFNFPLEKCL